MMYECTESMCMHHGGDHIVQITQYGRYMLAVCRCWRLAREKWLGKCSTSMCATHMHTHTGTSADNGLIESAVLNTRPLSLSFSLAPIRFVSLETFNNIIIKSHVVSLMQLRIIYHSLFTKIRTRIALRKCEMMNGAMRLANYRMRRCVAESKWKLNICINHLKFIILLKTAAATATTVATVMPIRIVLAQNHYYYQRSGIESHFRCAVSGFTHSARHCQWQISISIERKYCCVS